METNYFVYLEQQAQATVTAQGAPGPEVKTVRKKRQRRISRPPAQSPQPIICADQQQQQSTHTNALGREQEAPVVRRIRGQIDELTSRLLIFDPSQAISEGLHISLLSTLQTTNAIMEMYNDKTRSRTSDPGVDPAFIDMRPRVSPQHDDQTRICTGESCVSPQFIDMTSRASLESGVNAQAPANLVEQDQQNQFCGDGGPYNQQQQDRRLHTPPPDQGSGLLFFPDYVAGQPPVADRLFVPLLAQQQNVPDEDMQEQQTQRRKMNVKGGGGRIKED